MEAAVNVFAFAFRFLMRLKIPSFITPRDAKTEVITSCPMYSHFSLLKKRGYVGYTSLLET